MEPRFHVPPVDRSRRAVLRSAVALAGVAAVAPSASLAAGRAFAPAFVTRPTRGCAKNVIFMVSDGMAAGTLALADHFQRHTTGKQSFWTSLINQRGVARTLVSTHSADSVVTDSAAASAAWSTGKKHRNGTLCWGLDNRPITPLLVRAKREGRRVGVVTTTTITHATPAGFYASSPKRDLQGEIGAILVASGVDLALGGGSMYVPRSLTSGKPEITHLTTRDELLAFDSPKLAPDRRLIGTFDPDHVRMVLDRPPSQPSLEEMTRVALAALAPAPDGFVLQIEGGRVDHAGHINDAVGILPEQLEFERTAKLAFDFASSRDDTLLVITTDHATGNPGLTLYGQQSRRALTLLADAKHTFEWIFAQAHVSDRGRKSDELASSIAALLQQHMKITLGPTRTRVLQRALAGEAADPFAERCIIACVLGSLLADDLGVAFISPNHSADHVEQLAFGPGADLIAGFRDNTEVHAWVADALALAPA